MPEEMKKCIERVEAVDTRNGIDQLRMKGVQLAPPIIENKVRFSQSSGEIGRYLSHLHVWKKISEEEIDMAIILEDDVVASDVMNLLLTGVDVKEGIDLTLLNTSGFGSSDAYMLSLSAARKILDLHEDHSDFECFLRDRDWEMDEEALAVKNSICAPVNLFLEHCCNPNLGDLGCTVDFFSCIDLCDLTSSDSSIISKEDTSFFEMDKEHLDWFKNSSFFEYWKRDYFTSICICTANNYKSLYRTLVSCNDILTNKDQFEIIVFDNTPEYILKQNNKFDSDKVEYFGMCMELINQTENAFYYYKEVGGLSHARNECIQKSKGDLIYFFDDDTVLDENIVNNAVQQFKNHGKLGVLGGKVLCNFECEEPEWLTKDHLKLFSHVDFGNKRIFLNDKDSEAWIVGANMCFRKCVLIKHGKFTQGLGRRGSALLSSEECDVISKVQDSNLVIYEPSCRVNHMIGRDKLNQPWLLKRAAWQVVSDQIRGEDAMKNVTNPYNFLRQNIGIIFSEASSEKDFALQGLVTSLLSFWILNHGRPLITKIPKIIHQIHLGNKPLSDEELFWQDSWKKHHPDWEYILWDDERVSTLKMENEKAFVACKNFSEQSDVLRFELLNQFGGLYVDTDFECLKNVENFFMEKDFVICKQTKNSLCGAFMACIPGHPFIKKLIEDLPARMVTHGHKDFGLATAAIKYGPEYINDTLGVGIGMEPYYVYPYLWFENHRRSENFRETSPESYAVHHWAGTSMFVDKANFYKCLMISLSDKKFSKYENISFVERFEAVDTRSDYKEVLKEHGLTEQIDEEWKDHFFSSTPGNGRGAFGCFISHFLIWKKVANHSNDRDWFLILEDDVLVEDLLRFSIDRSFEIPEGLDILNLNNRPDPWKEFDGSDAYMIKKSTAVKLIDFCKDKILAPLDKILFDPRYFRKDESIRYKHQKEIGMSSDWQDSCLSEEGDKESFEEAQNKSPLKELDKEEEEEELFGFRGGEEENLNEAIQEVIPRIIHYCWFGNGEKPEIVEKCIKSWKKNLTGYEIKEWNEENSPMESAYMKNAAKHNKYSNMSNFVRTHALKTEGGIYLDTDMEVFKDFEQQLSDKCFLGFQYSKDSLKKFPEGINELVNGAVIGAVKNHPFIEKLQEKVVNNFDGTEESNLSGPFSTTESLRDMGLIGLSDDHLEDLRLYSFEYFYPTPWWREFELSDKTQDTVCVHHWTKLW
tara:strand:- start:6647 stop:10270 length:3624 start_codon:yes stop_codon:yes gene_type:complete